MASTPERSREVAADWGVEHAYADIDDVVASDAEIVHICTPNASHVPFAVALMEAGKHVLCEKPLGVGVADAQQAADAAARTGVVNTIPFAYRYHPMAREMRPGCRTRTSERSTWCTAATCRTGCSTPARPAGGWTARPAVRPVRSATSARTGAT